MAEPTLKQRLCTPPPPFFKKLRTICITLSAVGAAILGAQETIQINDTIIHIANYMILAGVVGGAVAGSTVDRSKIKK